MTRFRLAASAALLLAGSLGCNLILGTQPPLPATGGAGGGASTTVGAGGGGPVPCDGDEWTHWSPAAAHTFVSKTGQDGNAYLTDEITHLAWQTPAPSAESAVAWAAADSYCRALSWGGLGNYRLPTVVELASLTRYDLPPPAMDPVFAATSTGAFWTGSPSNTEAESYWIISHGDGTVGWQDHLKTAAVRCVHDLAPPADTTCERYVLADNGDGVKDIETGLVWQRVRTIGQVSWSTARGSCSTLQLDGEEWRLPEMSELFTLYDVTGASPSGLDPLFFPSSEAADLYWSATPQALAPDDDAWTLDMVTGAASPGLNSGLSYARCVH